MTPHILIFHLPSVQQEFQLPHGAAWRNDVFEVNVRHDPEHEADSSSGQSELVMPDTMQGGGGYGHGTGNRIWSDQLYVHVSITVRPRPRMWDSNGA